MLDSTRCLVAVVGGGAAGLMAAISAAMTWRASHDNQRDPGVCPVLLLEKLDRVGKKLLTTGNGRCNLSNENPTLDHYHGADPAFADIALDRYTAGHTVGLFRSLGLPCRTEEDGRIYPYSLQASAVLDILRLAASRLNVRIEVAFTVKNLQFAGRQGKHFILTSDDGREVQAERVIVATGGLAAPGLGCDGSGYDLLARFGHRRTAVFPALVQVRTETDLVRSLAGIKFDGTATAMVNGLPARTSEGEILFTEYGLSGPPLLDLSRTVGAALLQNPAARVEILLDLLPAMSYDELTAWLAFRRDCDLSLELADYLSGLVNKKLGQAILKRCIDRSLTLVNPVSVLTSQDLSRLADQLKHLAIRAVGTKDWTQAQVTAGGLETKSFSAGTFESALQPGLYAVGEILDIDGDCGGYNLQWAWSSGQAAGNSAMLACLDGARPS